jgi:DNA-binding response OmpR family regulator
LDGISHIGCVDRPKVFCGNCSALAPKRILIVDDDADVSAGTATLVRILGHQPVVAWGIASARSIWQDTGGAFDVALIDYALQDGNGTELAVQFRREKPSIRIFLATGMPRDYILLPTGVKFIGKPLSLDVLRPLLGNVTSSQS